MQVKAPPAAATLNWVLTPVTVVVEVALQPLLLLVTFNVYVPGALTMGVNVFAPERIFPPLEAVHK